MHEHDQQIEHIAQEIERYLMKRPNAADSLEGITKWWLTRQRFEDALDFVQKALEYLILHGRIIKTINYDGRCIYRPRKS